MEVLTSVDENMHFKGHEILNAMDNYLWYGLWLTRVNIITRCDSLISLRLICNNYYYNILIWVVDLLVK